MEKNRVIKAIINDYLIRMVLGEPIKKPAPAVPNLKQVLEKKQAIRKEAYPQQFGGTLKPNNTNTTISLAIIQIKNSIADALVDLANSTEIGETIKIQRRLKELEEAERQFSEQLWHSQTASVAKITPK